MKSRLFTRSARRSSETKMDPVMMRATAVTTFAYGRPYLTNWDVQRAVRDAYERVIWIFRGIDVIASAGSSLEVVWRKGDPRKGQVVEDHPALAVMNGQTNQFETAEMFWYRLFSIYLLNKRGVMVELTRNRGGQVARMNILPPHLTNPIPDWDCYTSGFRVIVPGGLPPVDVPAWENSTWDGGKWVPNAIVGPQGVLIPDPDVPLVPHVIWVRKPHPIDVYSSVTPLEAAGLSIDTDYYARLYQRTFLQNDGRPGGIVMINGRISPTDADIIRNKMTGGQNAGKTAVIENQGGGDGKGGVSYVDTATTPRDAQYAELRQLTLLECSLALGVPRAKMGDSSQNTYENADADDLTFWRDTMDGHLRLVAGAFSPLDPDPTSHPAFDTSPIGVLQRAVNAEKAADALLVAQGLMTRWEWREKWGEPDPKYNNPATRALWVSATLVPQPANGDDIEEINWGAAAPSGGTSTMMVDQDGNVIAVSGPVTNPAAAPVDSNGTGQSANRTAPTKPAAPAGAEPEQAAPMKRGRKVGGPPLPTLDLSTGQVDMGQTDSVMVALFVPADAAAQLTDDGRSDLEPAEDLHLTLAFLGDTAAGDRDRVTAAVQAFAATAAPLTGTVTGYGWFDVGDGDRAYYATPDLPDLPSWRQRLLATLDAYGVETVSTHGYVPHITVAYLPGDIPDSALPAPLGLELDFATVTVAWGLQRQSFTLAGEPFAKRRRRLVAA